MDPLDQAELARGERSLEHWVAQMIDERSKKSVVGWLLLTTERCLFFRRVGLFGGGRAEKPPAFAIRLGQIRSVSSRDSSMEIGYGDRVSIPGIELDGREFRFQRETDSALVVSMINEARHAPGPALPV